MERDVSRLPKWAQEKIATLESQFESHRIYYERKMEEVCGHTPTAIEIDHSVGPKGYVPSDSRVTFKCRSGGEVEVFFNKNRSGIRAIFQSPSLGSMYVLPKSANVVEIVGEEG